MRTLLLTALLAALLTGCAVPLFQEDDMDPAATLAARPPLTEVVTRYEEMQQRIRDRMDAEIGPFAWYQRRAGTASLCGQEFADVDAHRRYLAPWGFDSPISDLDWPRAHQIIVEITAEYGFSPAGLAVDEPGRHRAGGVDPVLGARYEIGTSRATSLQVTTGCHRP